MPKMTVFQNMVTNRFFVVILPTLFWLQLTQRKDMLELILAAREDEDFDKTPHNTNVTKGLYDSEIVAHITHFFLAGMMM